MTGIVLCGGQSLRMGVDKGLIQHNGFVWSRHLYNLLASLNMPVVLSVNTTQLNTYSSVFEKEKLVTDNDVLHIGGPLKGILSVHIKYPKENLFVLACDLMQMQQQPLLHLTSCFNNKDDAFVYRNNKQLEPLCGIYTSKGLGKLYRLFLEDAFQQQSMHYALQQLSVFYVDVQPEWRSFFNNYNSIEDLGNSIN